MKRRKLINNVIPGEIPQVVGTVSTVSALAVSREYICDIVEIRLDLMDIANINWLQYGKNIEADGTPVLVTLRVPGDGGKWVGPDSDKREILATAIRNLSMIDIEYNSELAPEICALAERANKPLVVSYHDFGELRDFEELSEIISEMHSYSGAIAKMAVMVKSPNDVDVLRLLLDKHKEKPLCIIGMGEEGIVTRKEFPAQGAALTYGYIDSTAAPGQVHVSELVDYLCLNHSGYNQYRKHNKKYE